MRLRRTVPICVVAIVLIVLTTSGVWAERATGVVFHDIDGDQARDRGEPGIADVGVSNGRDVVLTDEDGRWRLQVDDHDVIFVIKPRNWRPVIDENGISRGYYIHNPEGSPELQYGGVAPTGPLPESVDFPLYRQQEPRRFKALVFGDQQVGNLWQVDLMARDVIDPIIAEGTDAALTLSLGDIANNNLEMLPPLQKVMGRLGLPHYYAPGNHDENYDAPNDALAYDTWKRVMGPEYYSFNWGPVHFLVLDDVIWHPATETEKGKYTAGIHEEQMEFIRNDLALVPKDRLVVYQFHIPVTQLANRNEFLALFEGRPNVLGLSAHTHSQRHYFLGTDAGWWSDAYPHHHLVNVTSCGAWWRGEVDWWGIPETPCGDGVPNGWSEISFDGNRYTIDYVPARYQRSFQVDIWAPSPVTADEAVGLPVYANVFSGSDRSTVEMRVDGAEWQQIERTGGPTDEEAAAMRERYYSAYPGSRREGEPRTSVWPVKSAHLWAGALPEGLGPGYHTVEVRATSPYTSEVRGARTFEVK
jgi:hypothetical protein